MLDHVPIWRRSSSKKLLSIMLQQDRIRSALHSKRRDPTNTPDPHFRNTKMGVLLRNTNVGALKEGIGNLHRRGGIPTIFH